MASRVPACAQHPKPHGIANPARPWLGAWTAICPDADGIIRLRTPLPGTDPGTAGAASAAMLLAPVPTSGKAEEHRG